MRIHQHQPSASAPLATIALVVACAGGGYAAASIGTKQLTNTTVAKPMPLSGRSEGFVTNAAGQIALPANKATLVAKLKLPKGGKYLVSATTTLGNSQAADNFVDCELRDGKARVTGGAEALAAIPVFGATITLQGKSNGGKLTLVCNPSLNGTARDRVLTATRVGTLKSR